MSEASIPVLPIQVSQAGAVRTITLNRPASLNSFTGEMLAGLLDALDAAASDTSVRALVITGAGRAFCAGQDLTDPLVAPRNGEPSDLGAIIERFYGPIVLRMRALPIPVVVAVNGVAAGAGANLALNADIVVAAESASFIQAFAKIGLVPDTGGTWLLPRLVGRARALGLALLADKLPAREAETIGLIWKCVPDTALMHEAHALAERLAAMPVRALAAIRGAIDEAQHQTLDVALSREAALQRELGRSADHLEGVDAFRNKRAPQFTER